MFQGLSKTLYVQSLFTFSYYLIIFFFFNFMLCLFLISNFLLSFILWFCMSVSRLNVDNFIVSYLLSFFIELSILCLNNRLRLNFPSAFDSTAQKIRKWIFSKYLVKTYMPLYPELTIYEAFRLFLNDGFAKKYVIVYTYLRRRP